MIKIKPTNSNNVFLIDNCDYRRVANHNWFVIKNNTHNCLKYYIVSTDHPQISLHRFVLDAKKGEVCDHINGDTFDNRRKNLRICTQRENAFNRSKNKNNTSGFTGVTLHGKNNWQARIQYEHKKVNLGTFCSRELAAIAYNTAAKSYFGEFARLNKLI